ncbi:MAG: hypothetical protein B6229_00370 [Spirochaetaceae bacterium 4572_7]|nr:MAG: hypothetical protein B6229_00370 [Spirochaetaceae bacterium 4572_7]
MVQRFDNEEEEKPKKKKLGKAKVVEEETKPENNIPMIPNYNDLMLGELIAIRLALEKIAQE